MNRPWGKYKIIANNKGYKVKEVTVKVGAKLSLQKHYHRSEHWIVVSGCAEIIKGQETIILGHNESIYIPKNTIHRITNTGKIPLVIVEIQNGEYLEEDDIIRFDDEYGRK